MLALRKLPQKSAALWEQANLDNDSFDDLKIGLIKEWIDDDNKVSLYVVDGADGIADVAMALTMVTGAGPKGASFFVIDFSHLQAAGLEMRQTPGVTLSSAVDKLHYDVWIRKGSDLRTLIEAFITHGEVRAADKAKVHGKAVDALKSGDYDIVALAGKLKDPVAVNEVQKVCNSTVRLVGAGDLSLT